ITAEGKGERDDADHGDSACPAVETCSAANASGEKSTIIDSDCSAPIYAGETNRLTNYREQSEQISLADTTLKSESFGRGDMGPLRNVMWVPSFSFNLVSVSQLDKSGHVSIFGGGQCTIVSPDKAHEILATVTALSEDDVIVRADLGRDKLYHVQGDLAGETTAAARREARPTPIASAPVPFTFAANRTEILGSKGCVRKGSQAGLNALQVLHLRTAHASKVTILSALKANALIGAQTTYAACLHLEIGLCEACTLGNMRTDSVPSSHRNFDKLKPLEEFGIDPVPLSTKTVDGGTVITLGVDYGTKLMFAYESKTDGQQTVTMAKVKRDWCDKYGHTTKTVHTDSASYFVGEEFQ
ncbi:hypothetical protein B484DRAFT_440664, partial [Ochromonadaceae sp. CCMP2298]